MSSVRLARSARQAALAWWLALLFAQALSQGLALVHAVGHRVERTAAALTQQAAEPWSHEAGDAQCRLVDALLALAPGRAPAPIVTRPATGEPAQALARWPAARREALPFQARAPPLG